MRVVIDVAFARNGCGLLRDDTVDALAKALVWDGTRLDAGAQAKARRC